MYGMEDGPVDMAKLKAAIRQAEGLRLKPYRDSVGKLTIGYGRNLDDIGISQPEADFLLASDINRAIPDAQTLPFWPAISINDARARAVIECVFNLGLGRFKGFTHANAAFSAGNYELASNELLNSKWAQQVGARAQRLAKMVATGLDPQAVSEA
jgi:lysozyme